MLGLRCRFACGWSWSDGIAVGFPRIAEGGDVLGQAFGWHAAQPADLDRFELAGHDQPVHERAAEPEPFGSLVDGQQQARWLGLAGRGSLGGHGVASGYCWSCRQASVTVAVYSSWATAARTRRRAASTRPP